MSRCPRWRSRVAAGALLVLLSAAPRPAAADAVLDWNARACEIEAGARLTSPMALRANAIVQTAVFVAVNAIANRDPAVLGVPAAPGASLPAAVAAASRATLTELAPLRRSATDSTYAQAIAAIPEGPARAAGIALGERAAAAVLAWSARDGALVPDTYRPATEAGRYVPTAMPVASTWPGRRPWALARADQFRPGPPPALASETWARDYRESHDYGARGESRRTPEQTRVARFWETTGAAIYMEMVRGAAAVPGRDEVRNARLLALVSQAMDDAAIAVFDAKYHYAFWRPVTAIRNGDLDGNAATVRDSAWAPFIETPMHPEYPCAHCIISGAIGAVLGAEFAGGAPPALATSSPTLPGERRTWATLEEFEREVANARVWDGVHYRNSAEVGTDLGHHVGAWSVAHFGANLARAN